MLSGGSDATRDEQAVSRTEDQSSRDIEEPLAGVLFELFPEFIGTEHKRDVGGTLRVCLTDHAGGAVRRSPVVGRGELLNAEDALAALSEMLRGGATHSAQAENDDI